MIGKRALASCALGLLALAACGDESSSFGPAGRDTFKRYVSIGTSISAGHVADGTIYTGQLNAWPVLVARQANQDFTSPLIQAPGCETPILAPLAFGRRLNGDPIPSSTFCAPLFPGIILPTNNVALPEATTAQALRFTPESAAVNSGILNSQRYRRVLKLGQTQVTAALSQHPTFISVELGGNDLLAAQVGIAAVNTPFPVFQSAYDSIIDAVATRGRKGVLVGLIHSIADFPVVRKASEIFADSALIDSVYYVRLSSDCGGANANNFLQSEAFLLGALSAGSDSLAKALPVAAGGRGAAAPKPIVSCADRPGQVDFILTPADTATINTLLRQYNEHIQQQAQQHGFAYFELEALYGAGNNQKPVFHITAPRSDPTFRYGFLTSSEPFGPLISVDGIHPSLLGQRVLANAAITAINNKYGFNIPLIANTTTP